MVFLLLKWNKTPKLLFYCSRMTTLNMLKMKDIKVLIHLLVSWLYSFYWNKFIRIPVNLWLVLLHSIEVGLLVHLNPVTFVFKNKVRVVSQQQQNSLICRRCTLQKTCIWKFPSCGLEDSKWGKLLEELLLPDGWSNSRHFLEELRYTNLPSVSSLSCHSRLCSHCPINAANTSNPAAQNSCQAWILLWWHLLHR